MANNAQIREHLNAITQSINALAEIDDTSEDFKSDLAKLIYSQQALRSNWSHEKLNSKNAIKLNKF